MAGKRSSLKRNATSCGNGQRLEYRLPSRWGTGSKVGLGLAQSRTGDQGGSPWVGTGRWPVVSGGAPETPSRRERPGGGAAAGSYPMRPRRERWRRPRCSASGHAMVERQDPAMAPPPLRPLRPLRWKGFRRAAGKQQASGLCHPEANPGKCSGPWELLPKGRMKCFSGQVRAWPAGALRRAA